MRLRTCIWMIGFCGLAATTPAGASVFLCDTELPATATAAGFEECVLADGLKEGAVVAGGEGPQRGRGAGRARLLPLTLERALDAASPGLRDALVRGEPLRSARIVVTAGTPQVPYLEIRVPELLVTRVETTPGGRGELPRETVEFTTARMEYAVSVYGPAGSVERTITVTLAP